MAWSIRHRLGLFAVALALEVVLSTTAAPAAVDLYDGARRVVQNESVSQCSAKAKSALTSVLQSAFEAGDRTGEWLGYGPNDGTGHSSYAAAIHCYPLDSGYVVTFTCAVGLPPSPYTASDLCAKVAAAFGPEKTAAISGPARI